MICHFVLNKIARKRISGPPFFISIFCGDFDGEHDGVNRLCVSFVCSENPGIVIYSGASKMADRKWLSDVWFGMVCRGPKEHLLVKFGDDISSRFGDSDRY